MCARYFSDYLLSSLSSWILDCRSKRYFCFAVVVVTVDAVWFIVFSDRQLFGVMNEVMSNDPACSQRCLRLKTYQVIPMTPRWMIYSFIFYPLMLLAIFLIKWFKGALINWHEFKFQIHVVKKLHISVFSNKSPGMIIPLISSHGDLTWTTMNNERLLLPYRVGMIEWIQNTKPLKEVLRGTMTKAEFDHYNGK